MRALRVHHYGEPADVLVLEDIASPDPAEGQVRVRVGAAACNLPDVLLCRGNYALRPERPFTPGLEAAGEIVAVGPGVDATLLGRRFVAVVDLPHGALAEEAIFVASRLYPIPEGIDDAAAVAMLIAFTTGHVALHRRGALCAGETLLVLAAAGGVGTAAVQLGKVAGARVIASASSEERVAVCRSLGADVVIDTSSADLRADVMAATDGRGVDVVYDPVGGQQFHIARKCTASEGRVLVVGFAAGELQQVPANETLYRNQSIVGVYLGAYSKDEGGRAFMQTVWADIVRLYLDGEIKPVIDRQVGLRDTAAALEDLAARKVIGKIVVCP